MKISLVGYMASGKTSLGQQLALRLGLPFIDLDKMIEQREGATISDLIFNKGELYFRNLEREVLLECLQEDKFVLALGGGTPCYFDNMDQLNQSSISFYLERSIRDLYESLNKDRNDRPLIAHLQAEELKEFIAKHLFERREFYEKAIFKISQKQKSIDERLDSIQTFLQ